MNKINKIWEKEYNDICDLIEEYGLSYYKLEKDDFIYYEDKWNIVAFWRIFNIWENNYELSSLWVDEKYRWNKLWNKLIVDLINEKLTNNDNLFLACKSKLENYYKDGVNA